MKAMVLKRIQRLEEDREPLDLLDLPVPAPGEKELLIRVSACGVCHTELDEIEGRTPPPKLPVILGHQIVGRVEKNGALAARFHEGDRVGVGWIGSACGDCPYCRRGLENLCPEFQATGRDVNGGYAQYTVVKEDFAYPVPGTFADAEAAPLLCAGAIGYRSLRLAGLEDGQPLGLSGFGASAHLVLKMARHLLPRSKVQVFARGGREREFALELGADWAGDHDQEPPEKPAAIIDTTPVWRPIILALRHLAPAGRLVINAIRKEETDKEHLIGLDYPAHLWLEKEIKSVANVARSDVSEFLDLAARIPLRPEIKRFDLAEANRALMELKERKIRGAKVLVME
ncbi:MAG: zinc-dependent alcohol dehydrogenase family protein [Thermodesulfobacteriota bacterium]